MESQPAILYPISFAGTFAGVIGMAFAPDALTIVVSAALFFVASLYFGELLRLR